MPRIATVVAAIALVALATVGPWLHERAGGHAQPAAIARGEAAPGRAIRLSPAAAGSAYWNWRATYPTGQFRSRWFVDAAVQYDRMPSGHPSSPADTVTVAGVLDPLRVTPLGPAPLDSGTTFAFGLVGGRVNTIVTHPTQANVAWFGSDGGGVWKTTNCCSTATTWQVKTDVPPIANIAIGWLTLDPGNPDVIYAGTGDFRRNRPFAFGASGLLKSIDGGETWQVLGTDVMPTPIRRAPSSEPTTATYGPASGSARERRNRRRGWT